MLKTNRLKIQRLAGAALLLGGAAALSGCHIDMWDQPLHKPYYENDFFSDRSELRPVVPNTVPHAGDITARLDDAYTTGRDAAGKYVPQIPARAVHAFGSPKAMLLRGQDRFNAFCSPCHGYIGDGNGMISQRGLGYWQKLPASYYTDRLRKVEDGYIYDVLVNGHGVMYGYGSRISDFNDRWAVVSYVRALQLAHGASPSTVPADVLQKLQGQKSVPVTENSGAPEAAATVAAASGGAQ